MYPIFILFLISLLGIIFMIWRKLAPIRAGEVEEQEFIHPFIPDIVKAKNFTYKNIQKYEHLALVATLRFYVKSMNILKSQYEELKTRIKNNKNGALGEIVPEREANKFLKMISDYKNRIRHIKTKIEEEEIE